MKSVYKRLLMFFIGLPLVLAIVILFPQYNHLVTNSAVIVICALGAREFAGILNHSVKLVRTWEALLLGASLPFASMLSVSFGVDRGCILIAFTIGALLILASRVFSSQEQINNMIDRATALLSILVYPGLLMSWIIGMSSLPFATIIILVFLLIVFANDSLAWVFGMMFGKNNRGFIPASPNKSIVGFIAGMLASIAVGMGAVLLFPEAFPAPHPVSLLYGAGLGAICGFAGIIGDLAESTLKRSGNVKDSGNLMPGRGGILDSIDSISFAAPVFYVCFTVLFTVS